VEIGIHFWYEDRSDGALQSDRGHPWLNQRTKDFQET
jgi:hypothetical protein